MAAPLQFQRTKTPSTGGSIRKGKETAMTRSLKSHKQSSNLFSTPISILVSYESSTDILMVVFTREDLTRIATVRNLGFFYVRYNTSKRHNYSAG